MSETRLWFGVLGPLQMTADGAPLPLGTPKQRAVLAMLVINRNRAVSPESLIQAAWEQEEPQGARAGVQTYISNLRRIIGEAVGDARSVLASAPPGYRLSVPDEGCDVGRFIAEQTAGVHAAAAGRFEQASRHLAAALAQWRGPVLDDLREFSFVEPFASAYVDEKVLVHTSYAEAEIACGRPHAVTGELEALTAEYPYREPLWAQLITAYYLADRQRDALEAYRHLKARLAEDLGIDPSPSLRALHERILRQESLDAERAARSTALDTVISLRQRTAAGGGAAARLRDASGHSYPLVAAATRIGRSSDNDIVLDDARVSRHHAVIIDTGTNFMIGDLRSANGVVVGDEFIRSNTALCDGDRIVISDYEFTFEIS